MDFKKRDGIKNEAYCLEEKEISIVVETAFAGVQLINYNVMYIFKPSYDLDQALSSYVQGTIKMVTGFIDLWRS